MPHLSLREITSDDATVVAALHAASWRSAYRGILSDRYLDHDVHRERAAAWTQLLATPSAQQFGILALQDETAVGFIYLAADSDPAWGTLIENLHVAPDAKSSGIGRQLLAAAARGIAARRWDRRVWLRVYDANVKARAFYARMGGTEVESITLATVEGNLAAEWRVTWPDIAAFTPIESPPAP